MLDAPDLENQEWEFLATGELSLPIQLAPQIGGSNAHGWHQLIILLLAYMFTWLYKLIAI